MIQQPDELFAQAPPVHHEIHEAVLLQEFGALEAFRQVCPDRFPDHPRPCEADQGARLGKIEIPQHGERSGNAAGCRVGHEGDEGEARRIQPAEQGARFRHLHEAEGAFHHARSTALRNDEQGSLLFFGPLDGARDDFAHYGPHRPADEREIHGCRREEVSADLAQRSTRRVVQAGFLSGGIEPVHVPLAVGEFERVGRIQVFIEQLELPVVVNGAEIPEAIHEKVVTGGGYDHRVVLDLAPVDDLAGFGAFRPLPIGDIVLFRQFGQDTCFLSLEPRHIKWPTFGTLFFEVLRQRIPSDNAVRRKRCPRLRLVPVSQRRGAPPLRRQGQCARRPG